MRFIKLVGLATLSTALILTGCVQPAARSSIESLQDKTFHPIPPEKIKQDLTRTTRGAGVTLSAYPYTGALVNAMVEEEGYKEALNPNQIQERLIEERAVINERSCFVVNVESYRSPDHVNLRYWGANIVQGTTVTRGEFLEPTEGDSQTSRSYITTTYPGSFYRPTAVVVNSLDKTLFFNSDFLCTPSGIKIDYLKTFELQLTPRFSKDERPLKLIWLDPHSDD